MRTDWWSCDGWGGIGSPGQSMRAVGELECVPSVSRRSLLVSVALGAVAWADTRNRALAQLALSPSRDGVDRDTLVVIFLRGGMDGLNFVVPYGDDEYHRLRPTLGLAAPNDRSRAAIDRTLDLNGFFGLNPAAASLLPLFREGKLGFVHAVGSQDQTRSHFEAMSAMERGVATAKGRAASGWIARYLNASEPPSPSPLRALALTSVMPDSMRGATHALALRSLTEFRLTEASPGDRAAFEAGLARMYGAGRDEVSEAGRQTLRVLRALNRLDPASVRPLSGATYPQGDLGDALKQVAFLIKNDMGLEVAALDAGGWDTHFGQGRSEGLMTGLVSELSHALAAFATDLGERIERVTLIAMTEFGRRCYENSTLGTDHGRGGVMTILGAGASGGKVHGTWPGLRPDQLEEPGDLRVTTDYRDVLVRALAARMGFAQWGEAFPGFQARPTTAIADQPAF